MSTRAWGIAVVVAAVAVLGTVRLLVSRGPAAPEERIRAALEAAARAAEERKVGEVVEVLSSRFTGGPEGGASPATTCGGCWRSS